MTQNLIIHQEQSMEKINIKIHLISKVHVYKEYQVEIEVNQESQKK